MDIDAVNGSLDINAISEATVRAIETVNQLPRVKPAAVGEALGGSVSAIDADALNRAMGNGKSDNAATDSATQRQREQLMVQQDKLSGAEEENLAVLAGVAVQHADDPAIAGYLRKNVLQAVAEPGYLQEVTDRVFSHVATVQAAGAGEPVLVLDADRYVMYPRQPANLTTGRSLNAENFFAYTWHGVASEAASAVFSNDDTGDFLVCASGEMDTGNGSSTDCVRLLVKDDVEAIATASERRVPRGDTLMLSGLHSVGVATYRWSGAAGIADASAGKTAWTAPQTPGSYTLTLAINDGEDSDSVTVEVYDILPVAIAQADKEAVYLGDPDATITFTSGSIATDGTPVDSLQWEVADQPSAAHPTLSDGAAEAFTLVADTPGLYTIRLTAGKDGRIDSTELVVQVREHGAPVANAGPDQVTFRGQTVALDGSYSYGADGRAITYGWTAAAGELTDASRSVAHFSATAIGEFSATLSVDDGLKSAADSITISVRNRVPAASDAVVANVLNELLQGLLVAVDDDGDSLTYTLVAEPVSGGVTIDADSGAFTYIPGGDKGCRFHPDGRPQLNDQGGRDVPVIKLCADRYTVAPGEVVNLTTSNSINAAKFSGYNWINAEGDPDEITHATFVAGEGGLHEVCVVGNIGQSRNTSTACVEILVDGAASGTGGPLDGGYVDCFRYRASDGLADSNIARVCLTMGWENTPPVLDGSNLDIVEDNAFSATLTAIDPDGQALSYHLGDHPALGNVAIDAATGAYTYTPNANATGSDSFSVMAHDGLTFSVPATVTVNIRPVNDVPVAFFAGSIVTDEDTSVSGMLGAVDPDGDVLDFQLVTQGGRGDVVIDDALTGAFTFNPHRNINGSDSFYFVVNDGTLDGNLAQVNIIINPVNDAPEAQDSGPLAVHSDTPLTGRLAATDVDSDALVYSLVAGPGKGSLEITDPARGEFVFTPQGEQLGVDSFTFRVSDGLLSSNVATVSLNILQTNTASVANAQVITVLEGVTYGGVLSGVDAEGAALSYALAGDGRLGSAAIPGDVSAGYRVTAADTQSGVSKVVVTLTSASGYILLGTHAALDSPPNLTATIDSEIFARNAESGRWTVSQVALVDAAGNVASFTAADLSAAGHDTLVRVVRSGCCGINHPPVAEGMSLVTDEDMALNGTLLAHDEDGHALSYAIVDNGVLGTAVVTDAASGAFRYTPKPNVFGNDSFSFKVDDGYAESNTATVTVTITPQPDAPAGRDLAIEMIENTVFSGGLYGEDVDGDPINFRIDRQPGLGTVVITDAASGAFEYTPQADTRGDDSFTYVVSDGGLDSQPNTVTVHIRPEFGLSRFNVLTPVVSNRDASVWIIAEAWFSLGNSQIAGAWVTLTGPSGQMIPMAVTNLLLADDSPAVLVAQVSPEAVNLEQGAWTFGQLRARKHAAPASILVADDIGAAGFDDTVQVLGNASPQAVDGEFSTALGAVHYGSLAATDADGDTLSYRIIGNGSPGVVTLLDAGSGAFMYTPQALGGGSFSFQVNDGVTDAVTRGVIAVTVTDPGDGLPVASGASHVVEKNVAFVANLLASDPNGDPLSYVIVDVPAHGRLELTDAASGAFHYHPDVDWLGQDSFTFRVNDGGQDSNVATVTLNVVEPNGAPLAQEMTINVLQNTVFEGSLPASDPNGDTLSYRLHHAGSLGAASVDAATGNFSYAPANDVLGRDYFTYSVSDGVNRSVQAIVWVNIVSLEQACGAGGIRRGLDGDGDGWADVLERAFGTPTDDAGVTPAGLSAGELGISFLDDDDADSYPDYHEVWLDSDKDDAASVPELWLAQCFSASSDGIKPRLLGFDIATPTLDLGAGDGRAAFAMSLLDNASGIRRVRVSLLSPSGTLVTSSASFETYPLLTGLRLETEPLGEFAEAGNRRETTAAELAAMGLSSGVMVRY